MEPSGAGQPALSTYILLAVSLFLNALANFTIKLAVQGRQLLPDRSQPLEALKGLALNPILWLGVLLFGLALLGYSAVLSRMNLSTAYPVMAGGGFLLVFVLSALFLREAITPLQLAGALCIILGIWLLLR
ncbi:MAG: hypothetical protein ACPLTR_08415 [Thermacetogeniaceae bacterium]